MRRHSLRSFILCSLALAASAILFTFPAPSMASPADHGVYVLHDDLSQSIAKFSAAIDNLAIQREAAAFLNSEHDINPGGTGGDRLPFGLSPEYAESYATDGLNFIDLRRRC